MLIAPGSFYIQLRFAKVAQAFQLAMDPCRRVIGSFRDYVPSTAGGTISILLSGCFLKAIRTS